jgi:hypothetical protein
MDAGFAAYPGVADSRDGGGAEMSDAPGPATSIRSINDSSVQRALSWVLLPGFMFILAIARGAYASHGVAPSARFQLLTTFGLLALLWFWFSAQVAAHRPRFMMDMGLMLLLFWFILVPYYMWHYERWRGLAKVFVLCMVYVASVVLSVLVAVVLS